MLLGAIRGYGDALALIAAVLLSVVLLTCGPARTDPARKGLGVDPKDLEEQWSVLKDTTDDLEELDFSTSAYEWKCMAVVLESQRLRDMLVESSYAKDDWPEEERLEWYRYWSGWLAYRNRLESCSDARTDSEREGLGVDSKDLEEQWSVIKNTADDLEALDSSTSLYEWKCMAVVLESQHLRDMLVESSYAKDDWPEKERLEWYRYWRAWLVYRNQLESCSDGLLELQQSWHRRP